MFADHVKPIASDITTEFLRATPEEMTGEVTKRTFQTTSNILKTVAVVENGHDRMVTIVERRAVVCLAGSGGDGINAEYMEVIHQAEVVDRHVAIANALFHKLEVLSVNK
jgi:hypothetical protein